MSTFKNKNIRLAYGNETSVGVWSEVIGPQHFEAIQKIALGGRLSVKLIKAINKKTGLPFEAYVFEFVPKEALGTSKDKKVEPNDDL